MSLNLQLGASSENVVRSAEDQCSVNLKLRVLLIIISGDIYTVPVSLMLTATKR